MSNRPNTCISRLPSKTVSAARWFSGKATCGASSPPLKTVSCSTRSAANGFVEWPGEIDLAPDAMYDEIKANGKWVLD